MVRGKGRSCVRRSVTSTLPANWTRSCMHRVHRSSCLYACRGGANPYKTHTSNARFHGFCEAQSRMREGKGKAPPKGRRPLGEFSLLLGVVLTSGLYTPDAGDKPPLPCSMSSQNIAVLMQCYAALSQERRPKRRDGEWVALFVARVEFSVLRWELPTRPRRRDTFPSRKRFKSKQKPVK